MPRSFTTLMIAGALLALGAAAVAVRAEEKKPTTTATATDAYAIPLHSRHFELIYVAEIPEFPRDAKRVEVWIPIAKSDDHQTVTWAGESVDQPGKFTSEKAVDPSTGNKYVRYAFEAPFPAPTTIQLKLDVTRHEYLRKDFRGKGAQPLSGDERAKLARYLKPDKLVPIDGKIAEIAKKAAGDEKNILNLGRRFYDHVLAAMRYDKSGNGWGRGDALWACDQKRGNCTDFHALFIGLCRASGIPARFAIGFPIPEKRGQGEVPGYHCWAEFYVPGWDWVPVDISEADKHPELAEYYFGAHTEDRVEFTMGRDLALVPPQKGEPVNFLVYPYAELDGKPWDGVRRKFGYRDLE